MKIFREFLWTGVILLCVAQCANSQTTAANRKIADEPALDQVAFVHGAAGPFAVAGYRMGARALQILNVQRGSFALDVTHKTPDEVQWSCIADGVQAATGVSVGKLNLRLVNVPASDVETIVLDRKSGKEVTFRLTPGFLKRFLNLPEDKLGEAGKEVMSLPDDQIFSFQVQSK